MFKSCDQKMNSILLLAYFNAICPQYVRSVVIPYAKYDMMYVMLQRNINYFTEQEITERTAEIAEVLVSENLQSIQNVNQIQYGQINLKIINQMITQIQINQNQSRLLKLLNLLLFKLM